LPGPIDRPREAQILTTLRRHLGSGREDGIAPVKALYEEIDINRKLVDLLVDESRKTIAAARRVHETVNFPLNFFSSVLHAYLADVGKKYEQARSEADEKGEEIPEELHRWNEYMTQHIPESTTDEDLWNELIKSVIYAFTPE
jgi:hypothetical protein